MHIRTVLGFILTALLAGTAHAAEKVATEPQEVVKAFCAAVSNRDLPRALSHLAQGSVQFSLRPSHTGMGAQPAALTGDLRTHWSTIGPVLFSATKSYTRTPQVIDTRIDGDIATVWTTVTVRTLRTDNPAAREDRFAELYLLVKQDGQWRIGAVADNRRPNDVGIGAPAAQGQ